MNKIKINKKQLLEFQRNFTYLIGQMNQEGDKIPYNSMFRLKDMVTNREAIIIEDLFEVTEN